jgi:hypothetical protein
LQCYSLLQWVRNLDLRHFGVHLGPMHVNRGLNSGLSMWQTLYKRTGERGWGLEPTWGRRLCRGVGTRGAGSLIYPRLLLGPYEA